MRALGQSAEIVPEPGFDPAWPAVDDERGQHLADPLPAPDSFAMYGIRHRFRKADLEAALRHADHNQLPRWSDIAVRGFCRWGV
jgi:hypothetical protein